MSRSPKARRQRPDPWAWLCQWAAQEGIHLRNLPVAEAASQLLTRIEDQQAASFPIPDFDLKRTLSLASILVRLAGECAVSGSAGSEKLLNQLLYRRASEDLMSRAELVNASGKLVAPGAPAQPEPFTTLYELLCECRMLCKEARQAKASRRRRQPAYG